MIKNINIRLGNIMKMLKVISLFFLIFSVNSLSQTTYYVSSSQGDDANPGTSENAPLKTISKINNLSYSPGDMILFRRGDTWKGASLILNNSGTLENKIILGAYGVGPNPIISLIYKIPETNNSVNWTLYSTNIWRCQVTGIDNEIVRLFTDDEFTEFGARAVDRTNLDNIDNWHYSTGYLYIYSALNPAGDYFAAWSNDLIFPYTIKLTNLDFITVRDLDIRGGYQCIYLKYSNNILFQDCEIGRGTNGYGLVAHYSNYGIVKNCNIDSYWRVRQNHNEEPSTSQSNGITLAGSNYWEIYNNRIIDWHHSGISVQGYYKAEGSYISNYNKIYDNYFTAQDIVYGRAYEVIAEGGQLGYASYNHFYRNWIRKCPTRSQIGGDNNYVYFNIFDSTMVQPDRDNGIADAFRIEGSGYLRVNKKNYIFNNTIYHSDGFGIYISDDEHFIANNLIVNAHQYFVLNNVYTPMYNGWLMLNVNYGSKNVIKNNLLYSSQSNSSSNIFYYWGSGKTLTQFNALNGTNGNTVYANKQSIGTLTDLINDNYTLPTGSPAINAGFDISPLIPEGFTDRLGVVINRINPDIGAIQKSSITDATPPILISAVLTDSSKLVLTFSEPLNQNGITILLNYVISNGILVQSAQLNPNLSSITLNTSSHLFGQTYNISVFNLEDLAGNTIQPSNNSATYQSSFNPPPTGGIAKLLIINAIASDTDDVNLSPNKTIDGLYFTNGGNPSSRWAAMPTPQWLMYDLGMLKQVSKVRVAFYEFENGRIYTYNIYVSTDKVNWINVVSNAISSSQEWTEKSFNSVIARYVKIEMVSNNQNTWATVWEAEVWGVSAVQSSAVNSKIFLQGPYLNGQMSTLLRDSLQLPLTQPYNSSPWGYTGIENVSIMPEGVVDWILVELRTDTTVVSSISKRAAFIKSDGQIVDLDGESQVYFGGISNGNYYLVLHHRNHLSVMSSNKISISGSSTLYNFSQSPLTVYGNELADLGEGIFGMLSGDGDGNGIVNVLDYQTVGNNLFQVGYQAGDLDLNNIINILDYGKTNQNLFKISKVPGAVIF